MSLMSFALRRVFRRSDDKRDAGLTTPEDVARFDDIVYGPDRRWNVLDVYRPKGAEGALPVIVSVHGGGWVYGDKERYQYYGMSLARQGFAVVNFTYRLAPRHKFPAPLEDTDAVFAWLGEHAGEYGLDTDRVFAVGDSAGAHILGLYCCLCTNPDYARRFDLPAPRGFAPRAVCLNCGVYEMIPGGKKDVTTALIRDFLPGRGTARELEMVSVVKNATAAFPPSFVMTCEGDFLVPQAMVLVERLRSLGAAAEYHYYGDRDHVLGHVFHCNVRSPEGQQCNRDECDFFKKFC